MALTNWNDILNKPKGIDEVPEIALTVEQLSASVLSLEEDVAEIALDISQLSASTLPYSSEDTIKEKVDAVDEKVDELCENSVTLTLNEPSGIVSSVSGSAIRKGNIVEIDIQLGLSGATSSDWVVIGTVSKHPINTITINIVGDGHATERALRFNVLSSTGEIRIFHGASGTYNIHITYLCTD